MDILFVSNLELFRNNAAVNTCAYFLAPVCQSNLQNLGDEHLEIVIINSFFLHVGIFSSHENCFYFCFYLFLILLFI